MSGGDNGEFWKQVFAFHSTDVEAYRDEVLAIPDALLMGRKTYEGSRKFGQPDKAQWPTGSTPCQSMLRHGRSKTAAMEFQAHKRGCSRGDPHSSSINRARTFCNTASANSRIRCSSMVLSTRSRFSCFHSLLERDREYSKEWVTAPGNRMFWYEQLQSVDAHPSNTRGPSPKVNGSTRNWTSSTRPC